MYLLLLLIHHNQLVALLCTSTISKTL